MPRVSKADIDAQKKWEDCIQRAKAVRSNWKKLFKVDLGIDYFDGRQNPGWPAEEWLTINKIYSHVKATLPSLYSTDPYFYVRLKRSFSPDPAQIAAYELMGKTRQAYLNYLKDEIGLKQEVRISIQDAMFSYGICKVHHTSKLVKNPDGGNPMMGDDGLPMIDEQTSEIIAEPEYIPTNERYVVERVHPDDFLWDEDAGPSPRTWKWVAQCIRMTMEEARENPLFNKAALRDLQGKESGEGDDEKRQRNERKKGGDIKGHSEQYEADQKKDDSQKIITAWEIYEIQRKKWTVIAENGTKPLINDEDLPAGIENHPFVVLRFTLRNDSPYPIPPVSQGLDPQKEFNTARSRIMTHRKRFNRKYQAIGQWEEDELTKLETGEDGTIVKSMVPGSQIIPIADASLDQMGYLEINALNMDIVEMLGGHHDEARGIASADSATQAAILDKRLEIKEGDDLSQVIDFVKDIARKLDQLVQVHINEDEAVRITGPEGQFWQIVKAQDYETINGEFEYDVNVGSTIPRLPQVERASWMAFLQLIASAPQLLLSKSLLKEMATQHHIENEQLINEIYQIGQMMLAGGAQGGTPGSLPNVTEQNPAAITGGQAGGVKSLNLPGAGNLEG